mmetsp:Transcript_13864/g.21056  ORF Transcript_13864/g.21056 Transcript_13864/m.21056 type:complete len:95 (-) Transcript_13864:1813-2097(-)
MSSNRISMTNILFVFLFNFYIIHFADNIYHALLIFIQALLISSQLVAESKSLSHCITNMTNRFLYLDSLRQLLSSKSIPQFHDLHHLSQSIHSP